MSDLPPQSAIMPAYDAFMSYSHAADARFAPFLQRAVQGFAKPWYKLRSVRLFRDETGLTLTPELWPEIQRAISSSRFFILLASPDSAASKWVRLEIEHWLTLGRGAPLIVITGGKVAWDTVKGDFNWLETTALPATLAGVYTQEPLYLDATGIKADELSARHAKVNAAAAQIYSRLTNRSLDEVIGTDVREQRRNRWTAGGAVVTLAALGVMYLLQRGETRRQELVASTRRQLDIARSLAIESLSRNGGPDAVNVSESDAGRAAMLAIESVNLVPTLEGNDALHAHLALTPAIVAHRSLPAGIGAVALSRDGRSVAIHSANDGQSEYSILPTADSQPGTTIQSQLNSQDMLLSNDGSLFAFGPHKLTSMTSGKSWDVAAQNASAIRLSPDGHYFATAASASPQSDAVVTIFGAAGAEHLGQWNVGRPMSLPIAFSNNSKFLAFVDGARVAVVDVATGQERHSDDTGLVEIMNLAVDDSGDAVVVHGWLPDPRYIIQKNFVVRSFPTTGHSTFRPIYYQGQSVLGIRDLAIDVKAGLVAFGGGAPAWVKVVDYFDTTTLAVIRDDAMLDWTLTSSEGVPAIVTANRNSVRSRAIRREAAER